MSSLIPAYLSAVPSENNRFDTFNLDGEGVRQLSNIPEDVTVDDGTGCCAALGVCNANNADLQDDLTDCEADLVTCAADYDILSDALTNTFEDLYPETPDETDDSTGDGRFSFINLYPRTSNIRAGFGQVYIYQQGAVIFLNAQWDPAGRPYADVQGGFTVTITGKTGVSATSLTPDPATKSFNISAGAGAQVGDTYAITVSAFSRCETCGDGGFAFQNDVALGGSGIITVTQITPSYIVNIAPSFDPLVNTAF